MSALYRKIGQQIQALRNTWREFERLDSLDSGSESIPSFDNKTHDLGDSHRKVSEKEPGSQTFVPTELLDQILDELGDDRKTLKAFGRACRRMCIMAQRRLLRRISLTLGERIGSFGYSMWKPADVLMVERKTRYVNPYSQLEHSLA
ncbi:hypothetical protein BDN70DRAFT_884136 [Pholiota conissans]|uniref:Uncharacterized protein n=1 Tax=Pholiota conissans TaxID=109636 RepID=A0A9P5YT44_9AGAR|nr:hypothetical protein BDN70DRAFT_884136 [Pholiota conissans]